MSKVKIGINGFGRIGRRLFRLLHNHPDIEVVAVNDLADGFTLAHLLKYDSIHGIFDATVNFENGQLLVDGKSIRLFQNATPRANAWQDARVEIVIEATGKFKTLEMLQGHLDAGAEKVILSVPPADDTIKTVVLGVNDDILNTHDRIISNASCTTNNAAPMIKVVKDLCGIKQAYISTVHSYTTDQSLHDQPHHDLRRARAAGQSIVPTTTGAAKALTKIFPDLNDVIGGCGIRVPVPNGSLTDVTLNVARETTSAEINEAFMKASTGHLKGILDYTTVPLVSIDIVGNTHSCIVDGQMTSVIGNLVKLIGWYDNETGYSSRLIDLILKIS
ncbi:MULTISPECIES: type I glyceraldehyde-3-phosphate dehydrogenase [unclassified Leeuwenhoekiella]|uniref:type I glyceraldehyde-3-phosphate dehydrogenase n=1 Tax=unclassified Leeuwenhoekiella TaxID=2615029 RepID=UPI000C3A1593|nr:MULTISPECIES: type I glyceraldehyde-3-phosphate dehydrogenase [unclassified Leeuwenhoekiella]MAW96617.1 type I glyceraldehyde-3-phosphate dehydrogenase [Leeuwenhoekiella sp.]MBA81505.1 type I glyceraldehyde-3-phosphate dehydrogenase [Leeuwenhoekiella sp.]|tara:strand:- start:32871 stop:33866 length:996 start_codon:yes stop_codon:yes gene_type:complete